MKFEMPEIEVKKFDFVDILTASGSAGTGVEDGVGSEGGTCKGTTADYWEENCPPY